MDKLQAGRPEKWKLHYGDIDNWQLIPEGVRHLWTRINNSISMQRRCKVVAIDLKKLIECHFMGLLVGYSLRSHGIHWVDMVIINEGVESIRSDPIRFGLMFLNNYYRLNEFICR